MLESRLTLCMVFEGIGPYNAIGKIAMAQVRVALDAGWRVTVVAKRLHESLRDRVEWLPLTVPPRLHYLQWITARYFIRRALAGRHFDLIHAHQPQVADLADVFQCHFLTRAAYERKCLERRSSPRAWLLRLQQQGVLHAEDTLYHGWNGSTLILFSSELMRREFARIYGEPSRQDVLVHPLPASSPPNEAERTEARRELVGAHRGPVLGYLGGIQERKGYHRLIEALEGDNDIFLLMGGIYSDAFDAPGLHGRFRAIGLTDDVERFYAACDAFIVPSVFEPTGLVAYEAAARGVPVITTEQVGALEELTRFGAGEPWQPSQPLPPLVHRVVARRSTYASSSRRMATELSESRFGERLLQLYDHVVEKKRTAVAASRVTAIRATGT